MSEEIIINPIVMNASDLEFLEIMKHNREQIYNAFAIPINLLGYRESVIAKAEDGFFKYGR